MAGVAMAADWPQWRGPNRDGISQETGLLESWPASGPPLVWKARGLGEGYSGPAVVGNRLYVQGQEGNQAFVLALDTNTGKQVWKTPGGLGFRESHGNGPRGTPTVDGNRLYAVGADGTLLCLDTETGRKIWSVNFQAKFGGTLPQWAYSESPLIEGDRVIVVPGGPRSSIVALNKLTGEVIWKSLSDPAGYSSAMPFTTGPVRGVTVFTAGGAVGLNIDNGQPLWRYQRAGNDTANVATPVVRDGYVFVSSDYGTGCALLKITFEGNAVKAHEVYFNRDMRNHYTTSVLVGNHLYGFSSSILTAMDFMTGKVAWKDRSVGKGNCIYAGNRLYCLGEDGKIALIQPDPAAYKEISRFGIPTGSYPTWTPPVVANGRLYLRDQNTLFAYNIGK